MSEKIMVDTQNYVVSCKRLPDLLLIISSCAKCEFHKGILEVWPGKDGQAVKVTASDVTVETFTNDENIDTGKNRIYDIICAFPNKRRAAIFAQLPDMEG